MMVILFLAFNTAIFIQYANLLSRWGLTRWAEKFLFAYFLLMVQIIGTLLFLGTIGYLFPLPAIVINALVILSLTYFARPTGRDHPPIPVWGIWREILSPLSNKIIAGCSVLVIGWLLLCAYFLPPRVADEITYHLPFIYESIQRGHWALLPTDLRVQFAYPMNAEVLFSWPVLFLGNTQWMDASQIPIGIWTAGIIYLFARHFGLRRTKAFLLAGIFFLTPIVIAQMGTNYIDLTCAGFLLCSLYLTIRFFGTSKRIYLRLSFLSIGTMMGIKYHVLFWGIMLALILFFILIRKGWKRDFLWGLMVVVGLGLGWHIRNLWLFSNWIYPCSQVTAHDFRTDYPSVTGIFFALMNKIWLIFVIGVNNATVDGGLGRDYGLMIFLFWVLGGWIFLCRKDRWKKGEILFFGIALSFLLIIIPIKKEPFPWLGQRTFLTAWPIFLIIFGRISFILSKKAWIHKIIIAIFFLGFILDIKANINSLWPAHHWWGRIKSSRFELYRYSAWYVGRLGPCTTVLDIMTQSLPRRSTVYLAAPADKFFSAPFYGSFLQTKIINFDPQFKGDPDFLVYLTISHDPLIYIGKYRKTLTEAMSSNYIKFYSCPFGIIFVHPRFFKDINLKNS